VITSTAVTVANEDSTYHYALKATDVDSDTLTLSASLLPTWLSFDTTTGILSGTPTNNDVGNHPVTLSVNDGAIDIKQDFTITVSNTNDAPVITSTAVTVASEDSTYHYALKATDVDSDTLTLSASLLPTWLSFDTTTGILSGTPTNNDVGNHPVTLSVNDGAIDIKQDFTITVSNTNDAPVITSTAVTNANEDSTYHYALKATDVDSGNTLTLSTLTLPTWLSFDPTTGVLSGTPTNNDVGNHPVILKVNDSTVDIEQNFTITVSNTNDSPVITSTAVTSASEDSTYHYALKATDVDSDTLTLSASLLPTWLSFDATTGILSGTPTNNDVGNHPVILSVNDGTADREQDFTITVKNTNDAPVITSTAVTSASEDSAYSYALRAIDADSNTLTLSALTLPTWLNFDTATGILSGTPTNNDVGDHAVILKVNDSIINVEQVFIITVASNTNDSSGRPEQSFGLIDGTTDTDGDGMPDVAEVMAGRDPLSDSDSEDAPTISLESTSLDLLAKGIFSAYTRDELGVSASEGITPVAYLKQGACETAVPYNYTEVCSTVPASGFVSGENKLWWLATDSEGNWAKAEQTLNISPQISFTGDLTLAGDAGAGFVETSLVLSGQLVSPTVLTVPFTVTGTATNPENYNLLSEGFTFQPGAMVSDPIRITLGAHPVDGSTIEINLRTTDDLLSVQTNSTSQLLAVGAKTNQVITISQQKYTPLLSNIRGTQGTSNQIQGMILDKVNGDVTLLFDITDPDSGNYTYSWKNSSPALLTSETQSLKTQTVANPKIDLSSIEVGNYYLEVEVTDDTAPNTKPAKLGMILKIVDNLILANTTDSDGDGKNDAEEGMGDNDGDGRPNYLDAYDDQANIAPADNNQQQNYLVKTQPGFKIIIGTTAGTASNGDISVTQKDLERYAHHGQNVGNAKLANARIDDIFDYEIENIPVPVDTTIGNSASIIFPLSTALEANSDFLKYDHRNGWKYFTKDAANNIMWSHWLNGSVGNCPEFNSTLYSDDINNKAGKTCLKVTLQDGGDNDADGLVNGRIIDPLGVGIVGNSATKITTSSGGGSFGLLELLAALLLMLGGRRFSTQRLNNMILSTSKKGK
ncbi:MAG: putative Ig domain-containing protein, partial [Thiotrichaceae bacterium]|nr:putative Ig domain-containing protein [Thiotrichaceae bacterium]